MTKTLSLLSVGLAVIAVTPPGHAQTAFVVPDSYTSVEAPTSGAIAGFTARFRQQVILSAGLLQNLQGKQIEALWFRRSETLGISYLASRSLLRVSVGPALNAPATASTSFLSNLAAGRSVVFDGVLDLPGSSTPPVPAPWSQHYAVRIPFSSAYSYSGGDLCLEFEGEPVAPPAGLIWWVDFERESDVGSVQVVGSPCGAATSENVTTADATLEGTAPGGTMSVVAYGRPGTPGVILVGSSMPAFSLSFLGATGCNLYVLPQVELPGVHDVAASGESFGRILMPIAVPFVSSLTGASLGAQALNLETGATSNPAGITTTNGLVITLASNMPPGNLATISSAVVPLATPFPATGRVQVSRGPVMRFEVQ